MLSRISFPYRATSRGQSTVTVRTRLREFQKLIPRSLQALIGKPHVNLYINAAVAPTETAVDRERQRLHLEYDVWFDHVKSLPEPERRAAIEAGGIEVLKARARVLLSDRADDHISEDYLLSDGPLEGIDPAYHDEVRLGMLAQIREQRVEAIERKQLLALAARVDGKRPRHLGNGMHDVFDLWVEKKGAKITRGHKRTVGRWITVMGDMPVKAITRDKVETFYKKNATEGLGPAAQVKHRDHLKAMLQVACARGWIDSNPAAHPTLSAAVNKACDGDEDGEKSFTPAQLTMILDRAAVEWADDADKLLALRVLVFSGARASEVCQLRSIDIERVDGVACMRFREGAGQSLKNKPSRRIVPLHTKIAADVLAHSGNGNEWLFPSFPHNRPNGHAAHLQAAFNGRKTKEGPYVGLLRGVCGITDEALTLHSTRHSFTDAMRRAGVSEDLQRRIVGHGKPDVHARYGGRGLLPAMAQAMEDVNPLD
jgi:integrase